MAKNEFTGVGGQVGKRFTTKTAHEYDPWSGERVSFIDVWLAENPAGGFNDKDEQQDAHREAEHIAKTASESGVNIFAGFENELAEIEGKSYDEIVEEQDTKPVELSKNTQKLAPKAAKPTVFFPEF